MHSASSVGTRTGNVGSAKESGNTINRRSPPYTHFLPKRPTTMFFPCLLAPALLCLKSWRTSDMFVCILSDCGTCWCEAVSRGCSPNVVITKNKNECLSIWNTFGRLANLARFDSFRLWYSLWMRFDRTRPIFIGLLRDSRLASFPIPLDWVLIDKHCLLVTTNPLVLSLSLSLSRVLRQQQDILNRLGYLRRSSSPLKRPFPLSSWSSSSYHR